MVSSVPWGLVGVERCGRGGPQKQPTPPQMLERRSLAWEPDTRTGYMAYREVLHALAYKRVPCSIAIAYWYVRGGKFLDAGDWVLPDLGTHEGTLIYWQLGKDFLAGMARLLGQHGIAVQKATPAPQVPAPIIDVGPSADPSSVLEWCLAAALGWPAVLLCLHHTKVRGVNLEMLRRHFHTVWSELTDQDGQWRGLDDVVPFWAQRAVVEAAFLAARLSCHVILPALSRTNL